MATQITALFKYPSVETDLVFHGLQRWYLFISNNLWLVIVVGVKQPSYAQQGWLDCRQGFPSEQLSCLLQPL